MRRDVNPFIKCMIYYSAEPKEIRPGFMSSYNASYTDDEITIILNKSALTDFHVQDELFGLCITGKKN